MRFFRVRAPKSLPQLSFDHDHQLLLLLLQLFGSRYRDRDASNPPHSLTPRLPAGHLSQTFHQVTSSLLPPARTAQKKKYPVHQLHLSAVSAVESTLPLPHPSLLIPIAIPFSMSLPAPVNLLLRSPHLTLPITHPLPRARSGPSPFTPCKAHPLPRMQRPFACGVLMNQKKKKKRQDEHHQWDRKSMHFLSCRGVGFGVATIL